MSHQGPNWRRWWRVRALLGMPLVIALGLSLVSAVEQRASSQGDDECPPGRITPVAPVSYRERLSDRIADAVLSPHMRSAILRALSLDLSYSTRLGGAANDFAIAIAVDEAGNAYVTGQTVSADFPAMPGTYDTEHSGGADAFVAKVDPSGELEYATLLGGSRSEAGLAIAVDGEGQAYVSGGTASADFPTTSNAFDTTHSGYEDVWVAKLDRTGSNLLYSTFLGGSEIAGDFGAAITVDRAGHAVVSGGTGSPNFPTTPGAYDTTHNGRPTVLDVFVAKLDSDGSRLVYSTFVGGICFEAATDIALDPSGNAYVTGSTSSPAFPADRGGRAPRPKAAEDVFVMKLNRAGSKLGYSTTFGGDALDRAQGIALDDGGSAYLTGWTESADFPTTKGAFERRFHGGEDAFVARLDRRGSELVYSTYLGGGGLDRGRGIAVDREGSAYVAGAAGSTDFPVTKPGPGLGGGEDPFVAKLDPRGRALEYATFLGGSARDFARAVAVDRRGSAYVTGRTDSSDFPTSGGGPGTSPSGGRDAFVLKVGPRGRR